MASSKTLGIFALAMINVAAIVSLRNLPLAATYGWSSIFFYLLAAAVFLIPSALVCAELSATWPAAGGVYHWTRLAFGPRWAFLSIWAGWMISMAWFPTILSFSAVILAFAINPEWAENSLFVILVMLILLWATTFINLLGMRASSWVSTIGVLLGTIFPSILLFACALVWISLGAPIGLNIEMHAILPDMQWGHWVFLSGIILGFGGMEITAYHVNDTRNPQRDYPRALALATFIILAISIFGTLSIATIIPPSQVNLVAGLIQVYTNLLGAFHLEWALPILALLIFIGVIATLNSWVIGPAKGILTAEQDEMLPRCLTWVNKKGVPVGTLLAQAIVGSIIACGLWLVPSLQEYYWLLTLVSTQLALIMYIFIFLSYLKLRKYHATEHTAFRVPFGQAIAAIGVISCMLIFCLGFIPPEQIQVSSVFQYRVIWIGGTLFLMLPAIIISLRGQR